MIKEFIIKQDWQKRPVLEVKHIFDYEIQKVHDVSGKYDCAEKLSDLLYELFDVEHLADEYVWMFTLDSSYKITGLFELSHGSVNRSFFSNREIYQRALLAGAVYICLAHCHPSGNPNPSEDDEKQTKKLNDACRLIGIPLVDHIILGCDENRNYFSMRSSDKSFLYGFN